MAGRERIVTELVVQGAAQFINDFSIASQSVSNLTQRLSDAERIRTPQLAPAINEIAQAFSKAGQSAAQFIRQVNDAVRTEEEAAVRSVAATRSMTAAQKELQAARELQAVQARATRQAVQDEAEATKRTVDQLAARIRASRAEIQANFQAQARLNTPTLGQTAFNANIQQLRVPASGQQIVDQLRQHQIEADKVAAAEARKTQAISAEDRAIQTGHPPRITYLSTLSAIHAASFLLSNRTFTLIGSFVTLGLAFSRLGGAFIAGGAALGVVLFLVGQVGQAMARVQQIFIGAAVGIGTFAVAVATAAGAAGVAGARIAADVEAQLAGLRAFGGATTEQLRQASDQSTELAIKFGISSKNVVEAASLFARAGGSVQEALDGATEAVLKLQVASQGEITAAQAAIAVAAGLRQFALEGKEASRVADVLAGAAQASALSFTGVTQAFIQAAPGARTLGVSIEDLGATIALLGNELVKGTITGTAFKQFLLDLINPSKAAEAELSKYGVSIKTSAGEIRPLIDVLADLNKALGDQAVASGRVTAADRARVLAVVFGSRAALAANILTREGAEGLREFRTQLEQTTATNIANVLLLPLNKQLEILKVTVEEVGRAFGGPLLEPIRTATVAGINFFKSLIGPAQLAGQIIGVALTGQGFGELQAKIVELAGETRLAHFLIEFANLLRNIVDVIQGPVISGIQQFFSILGGAAEAGAEVDRVSEAFDRVNKAVQFAGAVFFVVSKRLAEFIVEIVKGEGAGGRFRDSVLSIATAVAVNLVTGLVSAVFFMTLAIKAMEGIGKATRDAIAPLRGFANAFISVGQVFEGIAKTIRGASVETTRAILTAFETLQGNVGPGVADDVQKRIDGIFGAFDEFDKIRGTHPTLSGLRAIADSIVFIGDAADSFDLDKIRTEAEQSTRDVLKTFQELRGEIPNELSNLQAEVQETLRRIFGPEGTTGAVDTTDNSKAVESATKRVEEAGRDLSRRLLNIREDIATRVVEIQDRALERLDDIFNKRDEQLRRLARDTKERIDDLNEAFGRRLDERRQTEGLQRVLDLQLRDKQFALDQEELLESRALETIRTLRSRATEDATREFDQQASVAERAFSRQQDAASRAFGHIQQDRDRAFQQAQNLEERQLTARLKAEEDARKFAQDLQRATTPQERTRVQEQAAQSRADAAFSARQQAQLEALRQRQDSQRRAAQRQQEQAQVAFRIQQEEAAIKFRLAAELTALGRRRDLEDQERTIREREEDQAALNSRIREAILADARDRLARQSQRLQDQFNEENHQRQLARIQREASEREQEIIGQALTQANEVLDQVNLQLAQQENQLARQLRGIVQSLEDTVDGFDPAVRGAILPLIRQLGIELEAGSAAASEEFINASEKLRAIVGARVITGTAAPTGVRPTTTPVVTEQVVSNGVFAGLSRAAQQGIIPAQQITILVESGVDVEEAVRRALGGIR